MKPKRYILWGYDEAQFKPYEWFDMMHNYEKRILLLFQNFI